MARKRYSDEDCLKISRQVELDLAAVADITKACRTAGISNATYYIWRKKFGGMARPQLTELKALEKENQRLKKIVADLELDKLILKESLDFFKAQDLSGEDLHGAVIQARQKLGTSERRTCEVLGIAGSTLRYETGMLISTQN